ncbi:DNA-binding response regulator [Pseudobacillus sp. 179-B 2D1 NHS]|uniref:DNA-binding response regulator n=1 Tax=Pseudobacillus sp. 179-B 2D1 NHS TaxID=3374292 RepID=UPI00387A4D45
MNEKEIESILKDYHWMMNSIRILRESLNDAGERVVRQYGPDSDMPKAKGRTSDPVYQEYLRREKRWKKVHEYERKIQLLQQRLHAIEDEREIEVLHWLLEGKSYRWIAMHMGLSHSHIRRLREKIIEQLAEYVPNVPDVPKDTILQEHHSAC